MPRRSFRDRCEFARSTRDGRAHSRRRRVFSRDPESIALLRTVTVLGLGLGVPLGANVAHGTDRVHRHQLARDLHRRVVGARMIRSVDLPAGDCSDGDSVVRRRGA